MTTTANVKAHTLKHSMWDTGIYASPDIDSEPNRPSLLGVTSVLAEAIIVADLVDDADAADGVVDDAVGVSRGFYRRREKAVAALTEGCSRRTVGVGLKLSGNSANAKACRRAQPSGWTC